MFADHQRSSETIIVPATYASSQTVLTLYVPEQTAISTLDTGEGAQERLTQIQSETVNGPAYMPRFRP